METRRRKRHVVGSLRAMCRFLFVVAMTICFGLWQRTTLRAARPMAPLTDGIAHRVRLLPGRASSLVSQIVPRRSDRTDPACLQRMTVDAAFVDDRGRLKDFNLVAHDLDSYHQAAVLTAAIYRDLAGLEWDRFTVGGNDREDQRFMDVMRNEVLPWLGEHEPQVVDRMACLRSWYQVVVGQVVLMVLEDAHDILMYNGFDPVREETTGLSLMLLGTSSQASEVRELRADAIRGPVAAVLDRPYEERIRERDLFAELPRLEHAPSVDTRSWTADRGFHGRWWAALWRLVVARHGVQPTARDLMVYLDHRLRRDHAARDGGGSFLR